MVIEPITEFAVIASGFKDIDLNSILKIEHKSSRSGIGLGLLFYTSENVYQFVPFPDAPDLYIRKITKLQNLQALLIHCDYE